MKWNGLKLNEVQGEVRSGPWNYEILFPRQQVRALAVAELTCCKISIRALPTSFPALESSLPGCTSSCIWSYHKLMIIGCHWRKRIVQPPVTP